jgi:radical SAM protein with 4Fe4S-binding SPASM domain
MVQVNGDVTTCCLDEGLENVVGNMTKNTLGEIWYGSTMNRWRLAHAEGRFADSGPLCTRCNWRSAGAYPEDKLKAWVEAFKRKG